MERIQAAKISLMTLNPSRWVPVDSAMFRTRSILSLILIGLTLALFPLAAALGVAIVYVGKLAEQSQVAVVQAVSATQDGRLLLSQITAMERSVRQHLVLGDNEFLQVYQATHAAWRRTLNRLADLRLDDNQRATLNRLGQAEQALFDVFGTPSVRPRRDDRRVTEFRRVQDLANDFLAQSSKWVDREVARLQNLAGNATLMLSWLMAAVIPAVLVLAGSFAALIVQPLRRMAQAIHRLGNEDFVTPIEVQGPLDLELLGRRLDWLRCRLGELEQQKDHFLRHMSHELKTPLTGLREGAELLADQVVGPLNPEQQEIAAILQENSVRLQKLIEDLLNFNQALSRNLTFQREPVDLAGLVEEVIEAQQLAWKARHLKIVTDLEKLPLTGDREKLATVIDNLLSNAIKFSRPGGTIRSTLKQVDGMAQLEVQDAGPGFHLEDRHRVFEAFYQGQTVADGHVKGSGLGLSIARHYATAHQGSLEIVDSATSGGCIRLSLPINLGKSQ